MKRIPVDVDAPIACSAHGSALQSRLDEIGHLRDRLGSVDRTATGLVLHFGDAAITSDLERFASDEKDCCQFWGFAIETAPADVTLVWDGPADAQPLLDELRRYFESDEPVGAFSGLL